MSNKRAAVYARFSSHMQTEESIDAQVRACREYATQRNISIIKVYKDEAISGKGSKTYARRQYQALLKACDKGLYDVILIHKYNRIARSLSEHVTLEKRLSEDNVELIAVAEDFGCQRRKGNDGNAGQNLTQTPVKNRQKYIGRNFYAGCSATGMSAGGAVSTPVLSLSFRR